MLTILLLHEQSAMCVGPCTVVLVRLSTSISKDRSTRNSIICFPVNCIRCRTNVCVFSKNSGPAHFETTLTTLMSLILAMFGWLHVVQPKV